MEHLQHFGLAHDPFQNDPDLRFYFESASHRDAQRRVERGLRQHKGLTVLVGPAGIGKSLLSRRILESLEEEMFESALMLTVKGAASSAEILRRLARQIDVEEPSDDHAALVGQVYEHLAMIREEGRHAVLIIDDAQALCADALSEVASLMNLEYEDKRLVSILMVALPELDIMLGSEPSIQQRVDVRVHLSPLSLDDATKYLAHRISTAGGQPTLMPADSVGAIFKFGRGRPRLMNTLSDNALFEAFLGGRKAVTPGDVERAAADLGVGADAGSTFTANAPGPGLVMGGAPGDSLSFGDDGVGVGDGLHGPDASAAELSLSDPAPLAEAEKTRVGFADGPEGNTDGEIDDLFVELLDE